VLKGQPVTGELRSSGQNKPHYHIKLGVSGKTFDIAVNVQSTDGSKVLYHVEHDFHPPDPDSLIKLPDGFKLLTRRGEAHPDPLAVDFIREGLVHEGQMHLLEIGIRASQNDLENEVDDLTNRIRSNPDAKLYAFGSQFPSGIHDIHMNQGDPRGSFGDDNGIYQDGALFVNLPAQNRWLAVFIAFQTQSWHTDDRGNPISGLSDGDGRDNREVTHAPRKRPRHGHPTRHGQPRH